MVFKKAEPPTPAPSPGGTHCVTAYSEVTRTVVGGRVEGKIRSRTTNCQHSPLGMVRGISFKFCLQLMKSILHKITGEHLNVVR